LLGYFVVVLEEGSGLVGRGVREGVGMRVGVRMGLFALVYMVEVVNTDADGDSVDEVFEDVPLFCTRLMRHSTRWLLFFLLSCIYLHLFLLQYNFGLV
jgi:hypothetical protein